MYSDLRGELNYRTTSPRRTFGADAATTLHYYPQLAQAILADYGGGVGLETALGRRTRLSMSQGFTSAQSYQPTLFPALPSGMVGSDLLAVLPSGTVGSDPASTTGDALSRLNVNTFTTMFGLTRTVGRRSSIELGYDFRLADFTGRELDLRAFGVQGRFSHRVTRYAALRLGYGQRVAHYAVSSPIQSSLIHDLDLGIDYNRTFALTRSRQTSFSFTPGSSIVAGREGRRYGVAGNVALLQRMRRSWTARLVYNRGVQVVDGFSGLFFSDAVSAGVNGNLSQRLGLAFSAGYSTGSIESSGQGTFGSYSASAQANIALSRHWALSLEHFYYQQRFSGSVALPTGVPGELGRQSMRVGLRWLTPLLP